MASCKDTNKGKGKGKSKPKPKSEDQGRYKQDPDPCRVNDLSGVYQPHDPPTFEKVWLMFQETDRKWQETDMRFLESDKKWQETERFLKEKSLESERKWQETERFLKEKSLETNRKWQETERLVRNLSQNIGGLNNSVGEVAEAYFHGAFSKLGELSGVKIKAVDSLQRTVGKVSGQFDIVVFGEKANILVEVKHKLREQDVIRFSEKTFPTFKRLYPEHCKLKIFGAVAGMTIDDEALTRALDLGLLIFTQSGQKVVQLNPESFEPKEF